MFRWSYSSIILSYSPDNRARIQSCNSPSSRLIERWSYVSGCTVDSVPQFCCCFAWLGVQAYVTSRVYRSQIGHCGWVNRWSGEQILMEAPLTLPSVTVICASTRPSFQNSLGRSMPCTITTSPTWIGLLTPFLTVGLCAFLNSSKYSIFPLIQKWSNTLINSSSHLVSTDCSIHLLDPRGWVHEEGSAVGDHRSDVRVWQVLLHPKSKCGRGAWSLRLLPLQLSTCEAHLGLSSFFQWTCGDISSLTLPFAQRFCPTRGTFWDWSSTVHMLQWSTPWQLNGWEWMISSCLPPWNESVVREDFDRKTSSCWEAFETLNEGLTLSVPSQFPNGFLLWHSRCIGKSILSR